MFIQSCRKREEKPANVMEKVFIKRFEPTQYTTHLSETNCAWETFECTMSYGSLLLLNVTILEPDSISDSISSLPPLRLTVSQVG